MISVWFLEARSRILLIHAYWEAKGMIGFMEEGGDETFWSRKERLEWL